MADNPQVQSNAVSEHFADDVEDSFGRLNIHENQEKDIVTQSSLYPDRPGEPDCLYYLRTGSCAYGSNCRFNHPAYAAQGVLYYRDKLPERVGQPDCEYFLKMGTCKYGSTCKYHHPKDRDGAGPVSFNILGLPMRLDEKSCAYYMRTGSCKFGSTCKFHHPQPTSPGTAAPVNRFAAYLPSTLPSPGLPYVGGFPTWSLPRAPNTTVLGFQGPQGYVPVFVTHSQSTQSVPGSNTYLENAPSMNMLGSKYIYYSTKQLDTISGSQTHVTALSSPNFPERPDQPECRYYMNAGTCKYGSDCRYNHPKERLTLLASNTTDSVGLPSRPGQAVCSNYITYGLCKFGSACRFDHPSVAYPYTFGLSLLHFPAIDSSSSFTYPRISHIANSSNTSTSIPATISYSPKIADKPNSQHGKSKAKKSSGVPGQADSDSDSSQQMSPEPSHDQS